MLQREDNYSDIELEEEKRKQAPISAKPRFIHEIMHRHRTLKRTEERRCPTNKNIKAAKPKDELKVTISTCSPKQDTLERKVLYVHGNKIEGTWQNGNLHGHIVISYQSGEYFQGTYLNGVKVEGLVRFKDGTEYRGGFLKDLFHGEGELKDPAGRIITCEWNHGEVVKKGKIQYPSGEVYLGEILKFKKHGKGQLFFKNGSKYVGSFVEGSITGYGCYYQNEELVAEGMWANGILEVEETVRQILLTTLELDNIVLFDPLSGINESEKKSERSVIII